MTLKTNADWSELFCESNSSFSCPSDQVMVGRQHKGNENGDTSYCIATLIFDDQIIRVNALNWSHFQRESASSFEAAQDHVLVGRQHDGDENGNTRYLTASLTWRGEPVSLGPTQVESIVRESSHCFRAPEGCVLVGRRHSGDENGRTEYLYARVLLPNE